MFKMGSNITLNSIGNGSLPQMGHVLDQWSQRMNFIKIAKTQKGGMTVETRTPFDFSGVWQPMSPTQLRLKEEGQRSWPWTVCHTRTNLELVLDDVIIHNGIEYRVMYHNNWKQYGYFEYHLVEDWVTK